MKPRSLSLAALLASALLLAGCGSTGSTVAEVPDARVTVSFVGTERFADSSDRLNGPAAEWILAELRETLKVEADRALPAGESVVISVTEVDLAGEFEPWRLRAQDVRIVKSIYPARIELGWVRRDASGRTLSEGRERLSDHGLPPAPGFSRNDSLHREKQLLRDWVRREFGRR